MVDETGLNFSKRGDDTLQIDLTGRWLLTDSLPPAQVVFSKIESEPGVANIIFDTTSLGEWDSGLLTFLIKLMEYATGNDISVDTSTLPKSVNKLIRLASSTPPRSKEEAEAECKGEQCHTFFSFLGAECDNCASALGEIVKFMGEASVSLIKAVRGDARFRSRDLTYMVQDAGVNALPIITLISLFTGMILAFVGAVQLKMFDAEIFVANLVGLGMTREMGALMTGVILAGRTGATYAAQIGTMQVNEELDALTTLGVSPMEFIALPRMIALVLMTPLLCIYADFLGIFGGAIVSASIMDIPTIQYFNQIKSAVDLSDFFTGIIKCSVFGFIVAVVGCLRGIQCGRSASAVGEATTSAVVTSIVLVVVFDGFLTIIFNMVGI